MTRPQSLLKSLHRLQARLYDYSSKLEDKADRTKSESKKEKLLKFSELASEAGFELDVSQSKMQEIIRG